MTTIKVSDVLPDEVRCMRCSRLSYVAPEYRGRKLRCSRCGGFGLNLTTIKSDPGNPMRLMADERKRRKAAASERRAVGASQRKDQTA